MRYEYALDSLKRELFSSNHVTMCMHAYVCMVLSVFFDQNGSSLSSSNTVDDATDASTVTSGTLVADANVSITSDESAMPEIQQQQQYIPPDPPAEESEFPATSVVQNFTEILENPLESEAGLNAPNSSAGKWNRYESVTEFQEGTGTSLMHFLSMQLSRDSERYS